MMVKFNIEYRNLAGVLVLAVLLCTACTDSDNNNDDSGGGGYEVPAPPAEAPLAAEVDPFIGTAADGMTFPGAVTPWGMASPSPHNRLDGPLDNFASQFTNAGYRFGEPKIHGFGLTHLSGVGCAELGIPVIAPTVGATPPTGAGYDDPNDPAGYGLFYRNEVAFAGYYAAELSDVQAPGDTATIAEMTATPRTAIFRFWFPPGEPANITVDAALGISYIQRQGDLEVVAPDEIEGSAGFGLFCTQPGGGRLYFVLRTDREADSVGVVTGGHQPTEEGVISDDTTARGDAMAFLHYDEANTEPVTVWVGLSYVSLEQARANLDAEQMPFDQARDAAAVAWQEQLGRIEVEGGEPDDRVRFYTNLYHALIQPSILSDVDGTYPIYDPSRPYQPNSGGPADPDYPNDPDGAYQAFNPGIGHSDDTQYTVFSLWDTFRTVHPLLTLVYPQTQLEMLKTMQNETLGAGAPPKWALVRDEIDPMVGDPALIVFADSYMKGLTDFNADAVYRVMYAAALTDEHRPGATEYFDPAMGFVPIERSQCALADLCLPSSGGSNWIWGAVSTTQEYAFADWALAQLAAALPGHNGDVAGLLTRANAWRGFYDAATGTLRPRHSDGSYYGSVANPYDTDAQKGDNFFRLGGAGFAEGTAWEYAWNVPHDMEGLIALQSASAPPEGSFVDQLQWFFDSTDPDTGAGRFALWNEPVMTYPYLFTFVSGEEYRTQAEVRDVMKKFFTAEPDGLAGNDDTGAMGAWFVFSAMGFYPVTPGLPEYRLGSPLFTRIILHLSPQYHDGETFVIEADGNGPDHVYATSVMLNGVPHTTPVLTHEAITAGGTLSLQMSDIHP